jgi:hypothetical protein
MQRTDSPTFLINDEEKTVKHSENQVTFTASKVLGEGAEGRVL